MHQHAPPAAALLAAAIGLTACSTPGGLPWSADRYVYQSNEWQPWTVSLIDARTGESLWSVDVPVGQQLVMGFRRGAGPNEFKPDIMYWGITENGRAISRQSNLVPVPPAHARRLEPVLRPTPEMPGTPLPGATLTSAGSADRAVAARKGRIPPGPADLFTPAKPKGAVSPAAPQPSEAPQRESTENEPPPQAEPPADPPPSEDPPIDLPQGSRHPG